MQPTRSSINLNTNNSDSNPTPAQGSQTDAQVSTVTNIVVDAFNLPTAQGSQPSSPVTSRPSSPTNSRPSSPTPLSPRSSRLKKFNSAVSSFFGKKEETNNNSNTGSGNKIKKSGSFLKMFSSDSVVQTKMEKYNKVITILDEAFGSLKSQPQVNSNSNSNSSNETVNQPESKNPFDRKNPLNALLHDQVEANPELLIESNSNAQSNAPVKQPDVRSELRSPQSPIISAYQDYAKNFCQSWLKKVLIENKGLKELFETYINDLKEEAKNTKGNVGIHTDKKMQYAASLCAALENSLIENKDSIDAGFVNLNAAILNYLTLQPNPESTQATVQTPEATLFSVLGNRILNSFLYDHLYDNKFSEKDKSKPEARATSALISALMKHMNAIEVLKPELSFLFKQQEKK